MGKVKVQRARPSIDMTPMVDLAFLLVTFFMLTTNFVAEEPVIVDMPSSISEIKVPVTNIMVISLADDGNVFFNLDGQEHRKRLLERMGEKYGIQFSEKEKEEFSKMSSFGVPMGSLRQLLNASHAERTQIKQPGIPTDSLRNELGDWIIMSRIVNPKARIAIKGDREAPYPVVKAVFATIQEKNVNRFNLITNMESGA